MRWTLPDGFPHRTEILQSYKEQSGNWSHTTRPATSLCSQPTSQTTHRRTLQHKQAEISTILGWTSRNCSREWRFSSRGQCMLFLPFFLCLCTCTSSFQLIIEKQVSADAFWAANVGELQKGATPIYPELRGDSSRRCSSQWGVFRCSHRKWFHGHPCT